MRLKSFSLLLFLAFFLISINTKNAFAIEPSSITVDVSPANPGPYENTTITIKSFAANLDNVTISWIVDGSLTSSGIGKKSFSVTTKDANSSTRVDVKIFLPDGEIDKNITIRPAVMVMLWQATDSYVPPFYKGKALPTPDSEIKVVAMPEIKVGNQLVNPSSLTYTWKKDYDNMAGDSGYGKNFFVYNNDYLQDSNNIGVVASTTDQNYSSESNIDIGTSEPRIVFYKKDASQGTLWGNALSNPHSINGEEVIVAIPYFISPKELQNPTLVWNWYINNQRITNQSFRPNIMPLKAEAGASGISLLKLDIENTEKIFQSTSKEMTIQF